MKELFLSEITQKQLCAKGDKILLAVSGGIDSMAMLHLFKECAFNIGVAHANFQLRGDESDGDEAFVASFCKKKSIPFYVKKFATESYAKSNHISIQMAARQLRYQWFDELAASRQYNAIATAHHLNDSIETVLLNLVRGSGLEGLDGIASKNGKIIRPLLFATRMQIENYVNENKIEWREDRSNATDDYSRNFIRHRVYPALKELNPSLENTFNDSIHKIAGAVELLEAGLEQWREKFELKKEDQVLLKKIEFEQFKNPESVLWNMVKNFGFNFDQCTQVIAALHGQSGKRFASPEYELIIDRDELVISKTPAPFFETMIALNQPEATLENLKLKIEKKEKAQITDDAMTAYLDAAKLTFPLRWRKWKPGDSFQPLGMDHKKKISDFLIDQKISISRKEITTVLESAGEIVWVVGLRIDDRYKVSTLTTATIVCHLSAAG